MTSMADSAAGGRRAADACLTLHVAHEAAVAELARFVASSLPAGAFVALVGDLGAGKTTFVKAVAAAAGIDPTTVVSPTFGLIHEYPLPPLPGETAARTLVHADMYRLAAGEDLRETGWEDAVAAAWWTFVEWPERIAASLPSDRLDVEIVIVTPEARDLHFTPRGPRHAAAVATLRSLALPSATSRVGSPACASPPPPPRST